MTWAFGWSCYDKAWVTFPTENKGSGPLSIVQQQVPPVSNWMWRSSHICCHMSSILKLKYFDPKSVSFHSCSHFFLFSHNTTPLTRFGAASVTSCTYTPTWHNTGDVCEVTPTSILCYFSIFSWRKTTGYWKQHEHTTANARLEYERTLLSASVWRWPPPEREKRWGAHICLDRR